jgi:predicted Zn finger-like uncharacterized protein
MIIGCPECSTRYQLPEGLMGLGGARVRCPECRARFDVRPPPAAPPEPEITQAPPDPAESAAVPGEAAGGSGRSSHAAARSLETAAEPDRGRATRDLEAAIARQVVEGLADRSPAISEAEARGRLFAEAGPWLLEAFDEYRRRAGPAASAGAFRDALRERWGIHLAVGQVEAGRRE